MKNIGMNSALLTFTFAFTLTFTSIARADQYEDTLQSIQDTFDQIYCFKDWKRLRFGWDSKTEMDETRALLKALGTTPDVKLARDAVNQFFDSTRDIHATPYYYIRSDISESRLPIRMRSASNGKFYIIAVSKSFQASGVQIGDELLSIDGHSVVQERAKFLPHSFAQRRTQIAFAEEDVTDRYDILGHDLPSGNSILKIKNHITGAVSGVSAPWTQFARPAQTPNLKALTLLRKKNVALEQVAQRRPFEILPETAFTANPVSNYGFSGSKLPFFPDLGEIVWQTNDTDPLYAYVFRFKSGQLGGFVRIGTYYPDAIYSSVTPFFDSLMSRFADMGISVLIYDHTNNSGGSVLFSEDLMRSLIDHPVRAPLSVEWIANETNFEMSQPWSDLRTLAQAALTDPTARQKFQDEVFSDKVLDDEFIRGFIAQADQMLATLKDPAHHRMMAAAPFEGLEWIRPTPGKKYLGPILILENELSISASDLTAALFEDLDRAYFFGEKTAGAGAYQNGFGVPDNNPFQLYYQAISFGKFNHSDGTPVENNGTEPDFYYSVSKKDLQNGMQSYRNAVVQAALEISEP